MKLYAHQKAIIDDDPKKCGLWLGTGSSKTRIALELAQGKILVIVPKTQAQDGNWERENKKWDINKNITVMSKETFRRDATTLPRFDTVIVDEAHTMLGVTPNTRQRRRVTIPRASQMFEALDWYVETHKPERLYLCTATIVKSPLTVWAAAKILGYLSTKVPLESFLDFRDKFYTKLPMPGREVYTPKKDSATKDALAKLVQKIGYVGRLEDYFDVPEQTFRTISVELTAEQKDRIKFLPLEFPDPIVLLGKRHQVENGVLAGDEFNSEEAFDNGKIDKILELAEEFPRMIVFAKYKAQINAILAALDAKGYRTAFLTGDVQDRGGLLQYVNAQKECIFVVQAQISAGWEAPTYPVMVFASMSYSYVDRVQAEGRILRANHLKKNLYIDLVVPGGVDASVQNCIQNKQDFEERLYAV